MYPDHGPKAFVVSGLLEEIYAMDPTTGKSVLPRVSTKRVFPTIEDARVWADATYPRVHEDRSSREMGFWAFLVDPVVK